MNAVQSNTITIGTRGSQLALAQTGLVADLLRRAHADLEVHLRKIVTRGDRRQEVALPEIGGKGLFTAELEAALLDGSIDLAVHSAKDLPTEIPDGLILAGTPIREDPRDALVSQGRLHLSELRQGAVIGTSSLRRRAQLLMRRADLTFCVLRGNVDTRIRKVLSEARCDATLLAVAGLIRTGLTDHVAMALDPDEFLPAAGQGALALQTRADDARTRGLLDAIRHEPTFIALTCERRVVQIMEGGCQAPIGVHARVDGSRLVCNAIVVSPDGQRHARATADGPVNQPKPVAERIAQQLFDAGAEAILRDCRQ